MASRISAILLRATTTSRCGRGAGERSARRAAAFLHRREGFAGLFKPADRLQHRSTSSHDRNLLVARLVGKIEGPTSAVERDGLAEVVDGEAIAQLGACRTAIEIVAGGFGQGPAR